MRNSQLFRLPLTVALASLTLAVTGCNGPSATGLKRRAESAKRIEGFRSAFKYDASRQELNAGRFDRALESIDAAIAGDPEVPDYHLHRGRILLESDRLERAEKGLRDAIVRQQELMEKTVAEIDERMATDEIDDRLRSVLEDRLAAGTAIEAEANWFLGIVYQRWNRDADALEVYRRAMEVDSDEERYVVAAGEMLLNLGRPDEVDELILPVLDVFEGSGTLQFVLARAAMLRGDAALAAARYGQANVQRPGDAILHQEKLRAEFAAGQYQTALDTITMISARQSQPSSELIRMEARCLSKLGRTIDAQIAYRELLRIEPDDLSAWIESGTVAWELESFDRVARSGAQVVAIAPNRWEGWFLRGLAEQAKGDLVEAERLMKEAAGRAENSALPHLLLGSMLEDRGDAAGARAAMQAALKAEPESDDVQGLQALILSQAGG
ncbi:MAG: tetratricopeptide repeat protein [Phycisphaerales bacterium]